MSHSQRPETITLNELLEMKGVSKGVFTKALDVSGSTPRRWSTGETTPSLPKAIASARFLGCSLKTFCRSIGQDVEGIPDDTPEIHQVEAHAIQERNELAQDLAAIEELLSETAATLAKLRQYRTRIKKKMR